MGTINLAAFDEGKIQFQMDYSDGTLRCNRVRCINNSTHNARATVIDPVTKMIVAQATFPANDTTTVSLGANPRYVAADPDDPLTMTQPYELRLDANAP